MMKTRNVLTIFTLLLLTLGFAGCGDDENKEDNCDIGTVFFQGEGYITLHIVDAPASSLSKKNFPGRGCLVTFQKSNLPGQVFENDMLISFRITRSEFIKPIKPEITLYGSKYMCEVKPCK